MSSVTLDLTPSLTYDTRVDRSQLAAIALTLVVLAAIAWRLHGPDDESEPASVVAAPTPVKAAQIAEPTATVAVVAQRLAGVALGTVRYAVVEQPDGTTALYRAGDEVPGLGKIVDVTANTATFEGSAGRVKLSVKPPPSPTTAPVATATAPEGDTTSGPVTPSPGPARSATGSPPSSARDQSAS